MTLREYQKAIDALILALELADESSQRAPRAEVSEHLLGIALCMHGMAGQGLEHLSEAEAYYQQTQAIAEEYGLIEYAARALVGQGHTSLHRGALEKASDFYARAERMLEAHVQQLPGTMRSIFEGQGIIAQVLEDWPKAIALYRQADAIDTPIHDSRYLWLNMGHTLTYLGQHNDAEQYLLKVLDFATNFMDKETQALALFRLGYNEERRGELQKASQFYGRSSEVDEKSPEPVLGLARIQKSMGGSPVIISLVRHGYHLLCNASESPVYDLKEEWLTCLDFLGKETLQGTSAWVTRQIKNFPANSSYWSTPNRRHFLDLLNHLAVGAREPG
ncbi:tetratricopeptide repeat protein [Anthocerotibacter panamensis]|uniref:tetratricopeptide repeat protein n=1 Tax=Anthocerotibacter panamensis TaxID=2857077 RepID=UPI001C403EA5|nr:tetratricopeptide repeat protein [Anthocerotibacter panamensis]